MALPPPPPPSGPLGGTFRPRRAPVPTHDVFRVSLILFVGVNLLSLPGCTEHGTPTAGPPTVISLDGVAPLFSSSSQCPHSSLQDCEAVDVERLSSILGAIQEAFQALETPTQQCTNAYNSLESVFGNEDVFTYSSMTGEDPQNVAQTAQSFNGQWLALREGPDSLIFGSEGEITVDGMIRIFFGAFYLYGYEDHEFDFAQMAGSCSENYEPPV